MRTRLPLVVIALASVGAAFVVVPVLVTHEADIAEYARRVVVFRDGLIEADRINEHRRRPGGRVQ